MRSYVVSPVIGLKPGSDVGRREDGANRSTVRKLTVLLVFAAVCGSFSEVVEASQVHSSS